MAEPYRFFHLRRPSPRPRKRFLFSPRIVFRGSCDDRQYSGGSGSTGLVRAGPHSTLLIPRRPLPFAEVPDRLRLALYWPLHVSEKSGSRGLLRY